MTLLKAKQRIEKEKINVGQKPCPEELLFWTKSDPKISFDPMIFDINKL